MTTKTQAESDHEFSHGTSLCKVQNTRWMWLHHRPLRDELILETSLRGSWPPTPKHTGQAFLCAVPRSSAAGHRQLRNAKHVKHAVGSPTWPTKLLCNANDPTWSPSGWLPGDWSLCVFVVVGTLQWKNDAKLPCYSRWCHCGTSPPVGCVLTCINAHVHTQTLISRVLVV